MSKAFLWELSSFDRSDILHGFNSTGSLYSDDEGHDSSSSGSNDIPNRSRPPPLRKQPALRSQATTIDNNSADNASLSDEPTRARSQTNDCMPANMRRKPFRGSPLATVNNGLSSSELILNNTSNIKRSQTTGSQFPKAKHAMSASVSDVNRNKPVTAPPALSSTLHNHDSDASESSDSRENVVASTARKKVKSRMRLFKLFKPKQHSSWYFSTFFSHAMQNDCLYKLLL